jgi:hypothetical protein
VAAGAVGEIVVADEEDITSHRLFICHGRSESARVISLWFTGLVNALCNNIMIWNDTSASSNYRRVRY